MLIANSFVTGYCDLATGNSMHKNMYETARSLDMPGSWIDVRHQVTHGSMPPVSRLRDVTTEAVQWLWLQYWAKLEVQATVDLLHSTTLERFQPARIQHTLRQYCDQRIDEIKDGGDAVSPGSAAITHVQDITHAFLGELL